MLRAHPVRPEMLMGRKPVYMTGFRPINLGVRGKGDESVEFLGEA